MGTYFYRSYLQSSIVMEELLGKGVFEYPKDHEIIKRMINYVTSQDAMQLRMIEESKIHCAREHFKAISNGNVVYDVVDSYQTLLEKVMK